MLSERLSDPEIVRRVTANAIPVLVDTDSRADVAKRFLAEDLPSLVLLDPDLGLLGRHENDYGNSVESIAALIDAAPRLRAEAAEEKRSAEARVASQPASGAARVAAANVAFRRFRLEAADADFARALPLLEAEGADALRDDVEVARIHVRLLRGESEDALRLSDEFLARRPESPFRARALYYRGYALMESDRLDEARAALRAVVADPTASAWHHAAGELLLSLGG